MANKSIKIGADFSDVKKGLNDLLKNIKDLNKIEAIKIFDKDTVTLLRTTATRELSSINKQLEQIRKESDKIKESLRWENKADADKLRLQKEFLNSKKEEVRLTKEAARMRELTGRLSSIGAPMEAAGGGGGAGLEGKLETAEAAAGVKGGPMGMALSALTIAAQRLAGAAIGYTTGRIRQGYEGYMGGLDERVALRYRGVQEYTGTEDRGLSALGYSPAEIRQMKLQGTSAFGVGATNRGAVGQLGMFSRLTGTNMNENLGMVEGLRGAVGISQVQKTLIKLQASAMGEEEKKNLVPWLKTASNTLVQLNQDGFSLDNDALSALDTIMGKSVLSPEKASALFMGMNSAIKGATGERSAFMQAGLATAGIGGGTLGGTLLAQSVGLGGMDLSKIPGVTAAQRQALSRMGLTGPGYTQRVLKGVYGEIEAAAPMRARAGTKGYEENLNARLLAIMHTGLASNAASALAINNILKQFSEMTPAKTRREEERRSEELQKKLEDVEKAAKGEAPAMPEEKLLATRGERARALEHAIQDQQDLVVGINKTLQVWDDGIDKASEMVKGFTKAVSSATSFFGHQNMGEVTLATSKGGIIPEYLSQSVNTLKSIDANIQKLTEHNTNPIRTGSVHHVQHQTSSNRHPRQ